MRDGWVSHRVRCSPCLRHSALPQDRPRLLRRANTPVEYDEAGDGFLEAEAMHELRLYLRSASSFRETARRRYDMLLQHALEIGAYACELRGGVQPRPPALPLSGGRAVFRRAEVALHRHGEGEADAAVEAAPPADGRVLLREAVPEPAQRGVVHAEHDRADHAADDPPGWG